MNSRPRILLADDHTMLLAAFQQLLAPTCEVVGAVSDGRALLEAAVRLTPDVIVLDISMPLLNGIEVCRQLQPRLPDTRWVFLTVCEDPDLAAETFRLGASGFLMKSSAAAELFTAIQMALEGRRYVTPLLTKGEPLGVFLERALSPHDDKLTARQREVLQLLAEGKLMKEVADLLGVTSRTVAFHKYAIMEQLGMKNTAELVQYAVRHGLVRSQAN
jgi:DNA-binding NarL/FixJ family response regulator